MIADTFVRRSAALTFAIPLLLITGCAQENSGRGDPAPLTEADDNYGAASLSPTLGENPSAAGAADVQAKAPNVGRKKPELGNEIEVVTACDFALKQSLVSKRSLKKSKSWRYAEGGGYGHVRREYEASNSFGGVVDSRYECSVNLNTFEVELLEVHGPSGKQIIILR
jgi:hypothetical protein